MFKKKERFADAVIVGEEQVSLHALQKKAKRANRKFWGLSASVAVASSMVLPYMSYAASVADSSTSNVFTGTIAPGYSMGGVQISAYGVDLNSWGKITRDTAVKSNYGVWSGARGDAAKSSLTGSSEVVMLNANDSANNELTASEKTQGWEIITGRGAYSTEAPNGMDSTGRGQLDSVSPYRTTSDYNFWDSQAPSSNTTASASINVSLYADFIICSVAEDGRATVLTNPDDIASDASGTNTAQPLYERKNGTDTTDTTGGNESHNSAIPYYVPLSVIFDAFGIKDSKQANITELMNKIAADSSAAKTLGTVAQKYNLLLGTEYTANNGDAKKSSKAFNPYPYTMVFSKSTDGGKVVSSMYENSEAYVYFSPSSVYSQYMALKEEYENLYSGYKSELQKGSQDAIITFRLGYYLAEMSILEAYLNEALPQDMTRGYVGASQPRGLANSDGSINIAGGTRSTPFNSGSLPELKQQTYSTLMYDVAKLMPEDKSNLSWRQSETNAIMDVLSVFGYEKSVGAKNQMGIMKGMEATDTKYRTTVFNAYERFANKAGATTKTSKTDESIMRSSGMYTPTYFPVQQHKMPDAEKAYRFQIMSVIPYETLTAYIKQYGFAGNVTFIFSTEEGEDIESFTSISDARKRNQALAEQYEIAEGLGYDSNKIASLATINDSVKGNSNLISLGGGGGSAVKVTNEDGSTTETTQYAEGANGVTLGRIDSALLGYEASSMNSDNVHDLFDVVRATGCLRHETWIRYYNPIKSEGGDNDLFLTRISPAVTTYFPDILVNGYLPAGGTDVENAYSPHNASFDYFSIPSFAPCFAAHTSEDTFYGVLNYELRAFYSSGFTKSLSENANIPAVGAYEELKKALEDLKQGQAQEAVTIDKNLAALYVMGKRLAYINTVNYITSTRSWAGDGLADWASNNWEQAQEMYEGYAKTVDKAVQDADAARMDTTDSSQQSMPSAADMQAAEASKQVTEMVKLTNDEFCEKLKGHTWTLEGIKAPDEVKALGTFGGAAITANAIDTLGTLGDCQANPFSADWFGVSDKNVRLVDESDKSITVEGVPTSWLFCMIYDSQLDRILGPNGTYYWEDMANIKAIIDGGTKPAVSEGCPDFQDGEKNRYTVCFPGSFEQHALALFNTPAAKAVLGAAGVVATAATGGGALLAFAVGAGTMAAVDGANDKANVEMTEAQLAGAFTTQMDACATQIGIAVENLAKDAKLLTQAMPTNMQNCLAWADYQNSSDSDAQYQSNPADANVTINLSVETEGSEYDPTKIKKADDLSKYGMKMATGEGGAHEVLPDSTAEDDSGIEGRIERGVEGSTWTATIQPAVYTMSATLARINTMSSQTGTAYPYAGLVNGRLESGTDRYAILQAHVIDYSSIASGIEGDLATRQRAKVVSLVEPQYAGLTDFIDNIGNIGAVLGESAAAMIKESSAAYSAVSTSNSNRSATSITTDSINNATAADRSYTLSDGTVMNRKPASLATFNPDSGKLEYTAALDTQNGYGAATTAMASGSSAGTQAMSGLGGLLIGPMSGIYAMLQSLGLMLVLVFIGVIGFRNFYAYSIASDHQMITAQTELKTVMWRAIIAVFMIGLPPLAAGGQGFEGGNYLLLQIISNVVTYIADIFQTGAFTSMFDIRGLFETFGLNIALWMLYGLCALVMAVGYGLGCLIIFFQSLCLFIFYAVGPIVWAFYVWPYNAVTAPQKEGEKSNLTNRLGLSLYSGGKVGNMAPYGHVMNFIVISGLSIAWGIIFWVISQVFIIGSGITYNASAGAIAAGYSQSAEAGAFPFLLLLAIGGGPLGGSGAGPWTAIRMIITTAICFIMFIVMLIMMMKALKQATEGQRGILSGTAHGIAEGVKKGAAAAQGAAAIVGAGKDLAEGMGIDTAAKAQGFKDKMKTLGSNLKKVKEDPGKALSSAAHTAGNATKQLKDRVKQVDPQSVARKLGETGKNIGRKVVDGAKDINGTDKKLRAGMKNAVKNFASGGANAMKGVMQKYDLMDKDGKIDYKKLSEAAGMISQFAGGFADGGLKGGLATAAQLAAAQRNKELGKELGAAQIGASEAKEAQEMADKILSEGGATQEELAGLSDGARKRLQEANLLDDSGKQTTKAEALRGDTKEAREKRDILKGKLADATDKAEEGVKLIQTKQKQLADGLSGLKLDKNREVASAAKTLSGMYTSDEIDEVRQKFHLSDDEEGRQKAREYLQDSTSSASKKMVEDFNQVDQWQRVHNAMHPEAQMDFEAARDYINARPAMRNMPSGFAANKSYAEKRNIVQNSVRDFLDNVPNDAYSNPHKAQAFAEDAFGCVLPDEATYAQLYTKLQQNQRMTANELHQLAAYQGYLRLMGRDNVHPASAVNDLSPYVHLYDEAQNITDDMCKQRYAQVDGDGHIIGIDSGKMHFAPTELGQTGQNMAQVMSQRIGALATQCGLPDEVGVMLQEKFSAASIAPSGATCKEVVNAAKNELTGVIEALSNGTIQVKGAPRVPGAVKIYNEFEEMIKSVTSELAARQAQIDEENLLHDFPVAESLTFEDVEQGVRAKLTDYVSAEGLGWGDKEIDELVNCINAQKVFEKNSEAGAAAALNALNGVMPKVLKRRLEALSSDTVTKQIGQIDADRLVELCDQVNLAIAGEAHAAYYKNAAAALELRNVITAEIAESSAAASATLDFLEQSYPREVQLVRERWQEDVPSYNLLFSEKPQGITDNMWDEMFTLAENNRQEIFVRPDVAASSPTILTSPDLQELYVAGKLGTADTVSQDLSYMNTAQAAVAGRGLQDHAAEDVLRTFIAASDNVGKDQVEISMADYEMYDIVRTSGTQGLRVKAAECADRQQAIFSNFAGMLASGSAEAEALAKITPSQRDSLMSAAAVGRVGETPFVRQIAQTDTQTAIAIQSSLESWAAESPQAVRGYVQACHKQQKCIDWNKRMEQHGDLIDIHHNDPQRIVERKAAEQVSQTARGAGIRSSSNAARKRSAREKHS